MVQVFQASQLTLYDVMNGAQPTQTRYGLVTNGSDLIFVKLQKDSAQYGLSRVFSIFNPGNDLWDIVGVLQALSR